MTFPSVPLSNVLLDRLLRLHPKAIDLSLDRCERLLAAMGNPQNHLSDIFHIAGTNGKGSTAAFLRFMLEAAQKQVHVYTSPHLVRFHERIRLASKGGSQLVKEQELAAALDYAERINQNAPITFFEITTAVAFYLFAKHPSDVVLLEVGLGGRLDATNVIPPPKASLITPVALDHQGFLGDCLQGIAGEKAGIIKPGVPVIIGPQNKAVRDVLYERARALEAPVLGFGEHWDVYAQAGRMVYQNESALWDFPLPRLNGRHQLANAGLAITAIHAAGYDIPHEAFDIGIKSVQWPARLQRLSKGALVSACVQNEEIWIDGGHNPHAGFALASAFAELEERVSRPLVLICGMIDTKDPAGFFAPFKGLASRIYCVPVSLSAAGIAPEKLSEAAHKQEFKTLSIPSIPEALDTIRKDFSNAKISPRILICGSLYIAGEALTLNGTPPD